MSEEWTHDCSSCGASCDHNAEAKDLIAPLNKDSAIKHVYAIMSGKGGVGKSSTTACLASAMAKKGYKVGIMDADERGTVARSQHTGQRRLCARHTADDDLRHLREGIAVAQRRDLLEARRARDDDQLIDRGAVLHCLQ